MIDGEAEVPVLWPPDAKSLLHRHRNLVGYSPRSHKESYLDVICFWPFLMLLQEIEVLNFDVKFFTLFLCGQGPIYTHAVSLIIIWWK